MIYPFNYVCRKCGTIFRYADIKGVNNRDLKASGKILKELKFDSDPLDNNDKFINPVFGYCELCFISEVLFRISEPQEYEKFRLSLMCYLTALYPPARVIGNYWRDTEYCKNKLKSEQTERELRLYGKVGRSFYIPRYNHLTGKFR